MKRAIALLKPRRHSLEYYGFVLILTLSLAAIFLLIDGVVGGRNVSQIQVLSVEKNTELGAMRSSRRFFVSNSTKEVKPIIFALKKKLYLVGGQASVVRRFSYSGSGCYVLSFVIFRLGSLKQTIEKVVTNRRGRGEEKQFRPRSDAHGLSFTNIAEYNIDDCRIRSGNMAVAPNKSVCNNVGPLFITRDLEDSIQVRLRLALASFHSRLSDPAVLLGDRGTPTHSPALGFHLNQDVSAREFTVISRILRNFHGAESSFGAQTRSVGLIQSGNPGYQGSHEKSLGDTQHRAIMLRLPLPALLVFFLLFASLAFRFYTNSINNEAIIVCKWTVLWIVFFVGAQVVGYWILVDLWG